ncbi:MAG: sulfatase [Desulfatibacillaceae bacterium]
MADSTRILDKEITRRQALGVMGATVAACATGMAWPKTSRAQRPPNVVFILTDDHRWDHMSNVGHPFLKTPRLDGLVQQGVRFNNAFVTTSLCSPSRASFLTGNYAHRHGVKNNLTPFDQDRNTTFIELFKQAGYDTAFIGKWHMPGELPDLKGADLFVTFTVQAGQGRYYDCPLIVNGEPEPSRKAYITEELTDRAIEFMEERKDRPFCLYLSHKAVHHQFLPPPDLSELYANVKLDLPDEADPWISWSRGMIYTGVMGPLDHVYRNYCETLASVDRQVGRVLDWLDENGLADDTILVYAGDNGYFWGEHRLVDKRWPYEESIRVPFIVRHPKSVRRPGTAADQMVLNVDLAPSLLEMAGLPVPRDMQGESFVPYLKNRRKRGRDAWMYEYFKDFPYNVPEHTAVRTDRYKYVRYQGGRGDELYDLVEDPREMHNLIGTAKGDELKPRLAARLDELEKEGAA